jgi:hypothetical protein
MSEETTWRGSQQIPLRIQHDTLPVITVIALRLTEASLAFQRFECDGRTALWRPSKWRLLLSVLPHLYNVESAWPVDECATREPQVNHSHSNGT